MPLPLSNLVVAALAVGGLATGVGSAAASGPTPGKPAVAAEQAEEGQLRADIAGLTATEQQLRTTLRIRAGRLGVPQTGSPPVAGSAPPPSPPPGAAITPADASVPTGGGTAPSPTVGSSTTTAPSESAPAPTDAPGSAPGTAPTTMPPTTTTLPSAPTTTTTTTTTHPGHGGHGGDD